MELKPSDIRFSQDSINNCFDQRSNHPFKYVGETLDDLCEGRCRITNIPTITVVREGPDWITADNRRLWVFRELERLGKCETIPVQRGYSIPSAKRTSVNGGRSVSVRRSPGGQWHKRPPASKPTTYSSYQYTLNDRRALPVYNDITHSPTDVSKGTTLTFPSGRRPADSVPSAKTVVNMPEESQEGQSLGWFSYCNIL